MPTTPGSATSPPKRQALSVSQLNRQAKRLLEGEFRSVWVEGELSNLSRPSSGHWYFTLKDAGAQVRCAMFRSSNARLRFQPEAGQQLMARAKLSLYEARGDYQLIVEHLEPAGDGAMARAFEQLKAKLQAEGLFAEDSKQALPDTIRHIAVVTSPTGAAIRDVLHVLERRFAGIQVSILPVSVQGQAAAGEIAAAIDCANRHLAGDADVILVTRGGGSLEDLWSFNEEVVARAIYTSVLPVVSAVGHEVDFSIADFVADLRAPTPSAAAELLSPDVEELSATIKGFELLLLRCMTQALEAGKQQLGWLRSRLRHPGSQLREQQQRLDDLELRLSGSLRLQRQQQLGRLALLNARLQQQTPAHSIQQWQLRCHSLSQRLHVLMRRKLEVQAQQLKQAVALLEAVSPLATLQRGYAIVTNGSGEVVKAAAEVEVDEALDVRLGRGRLKVSVRGIESIKNP